MASIARIRTACFADRRTRQALLQGLLLFLAAELLRSSTAARTNSPGALWTSAGHLARRPVSELRLARQLHAEQDTATPAPTNPPQSTTAGALPSTPTVPIPVPVYGGTKAAGASAAAGADAGDAPRHAPDEQGADAIVPDNPRSPPALEPKSWTQDQQTEQQQPALLPSLLPPRDRPWPPPQSPPPQSPPPPSLLPQSPLSPSKPPPSPSPPSPPPLMPPSPPWAPPQRQEPQEPQGPWQDMHMHPEQKQQEGHHDGDVTQPPLLRQQQDEESGQLARGLAAYLVALTMAVVACIVWCVRSRPEQQLRCVFNDDGTWGPRFRGPRGWKAGSRGRRGKEAVIALAALGGGGDGGGGGERGGDGERCGLVAGREEWRCAFKGEASSAEDERD